MKTRVWKWGFVGCSKITSDFLLGLGGCAHRCIKHSVFSSSLERSKELAKQHDIKHVFDNYEDMLKDSELDVLYIGNLTSEHKETALKALEAGKNVLCEKPMCLSSEDIRELVTLARSQGVFLMEAMWTRCWPGMIRLREMIESDTLGAIKFVSADFGFVPPPSAERFFDDEEGGALYDIGIYTIAATLLCFEGRAPDVVKAVGIVEGTTDVAATISLLYREQNAIASLSHTFKVITPERLLVVGEKGYVTITPFHTPQNMEIAFTSSRAETATDSVNFPLPEFDTSGMTFNYPHSEGMMYEADHVMDCLDKGLTESPLYPLQHSVTTAEILDEVRTQLLSD
jgi:dihydrodiol dehydrogenase / D-xylose 1-dehydrogenase (NADP)